MVNWMEIQWCHVRAICLLGVLSSNDTQHVLEPSGGPIAGLMLYQFCILPICKSTVDKDSRFTTWVRFVVLV